MNAFLLCNISLYDKIVISDQRNNSWFVLS